MTRVAHDKTDLLTPYDLNGQFSFRFGEVAESECGKEFETSSGFQSQNCCG